MFRESLKRAAPSVVTCLSLTTGLVSIYLSAVGEVEHAAWLVVYCTFLDKADGSLARVLKVSSPFGMEMDSFSDYTSFGLAPAALAWFSVGPGTDGVVTAWVVAAVVAYVLCAAIRLARFNTITHEDAAWFSGVPTTFAAGLLSTFLMSVFDLALGAHAAVVVPSVLVALAVLMVSPLRIPKVKLRKDLALNLLLLIMGVTAAVLTVIRWMPAVLFLMPMGYLVVGIVAGLAARRPGEAQENPPA